MKKIFILNFIFCALVSQTAIAQLANMRYSVITNWVTSYENDCSEWGSEEYTAYLSSSDNADGNWASTGCQTCDNNGNCTYATNISLQTRTNNGYTVNFRIDAWEDDNGSRCTYTTGTWVNNDDCRRNETQSVDIREIAYPSNGTYTNTPAWGGTNNHRYQFRYTWRYSGSVSALTMQCYPQTTTEYSGAIRSHSVYLTAGRTYRFETTAGPDTYLRLYGTNGYTIVAYNDDGGTGSLSLINYTAATSGWYYIETSNFTRSQLSGNATLRYQDITPPPGNVANFGSNQWNVYAFSQNSGYNATDNLNLSNLTYLGYYTNADVDITSTNQWGSNASPSSASTWQGHCNVPNDNHVVVYKRQGFSCGVYQIDLDGHDDAVRLYVDGVQEYENLGCCADRGIIHTGFLGSTSTVEFRVSEGAGGSNLFVDFDPVTVSVTPGSIGTSTTICTGANPAAFTSSAVGSGGVSAYTNGGSITYQWQQSTNGGSTWSNISGATALTYDPPALTQTTHYRRVASDRCGNSANSNVVVVTVSPLPVGGTTASDQILCYGSSANAITLSGQAGSIERWEIDDNNAFSSPANIINTTSTLTSAQINGEIGASNSVALYVRAVVKTTGCTETTSATSIVRYNLPDNLIMGDASGSCVSNSVDNWINIYDPSSHRLIASIRDNNQNLGTVSAQVYYHGGNSFNITPSSGSCGSHAVMNRSYVINSANTFTNPVNVRLYFTDAELNSLISNAGCNDPNGCQDDDDVCNINDLFVTQISGATSEDGTFDATDGTFTLHTPTNSGVGNNHFGANYVQFSVSSFSEFWIHGSEHSVPLPVEMTYFTAKAVENQKVRLDWQTATEINNEGFAVERSKDGKNFVQVGYVKGNGNSNEMNNYQYEDRNVIAGTYYYRLKQIDFDGKFEYSDIKAASIEGFEGIALSTFIPNPAQHTTKLEVNLIEQSNVAIQIFDNLGRLVERKSYSLEAGVQKLHFNLNSYTQGVYVAKIRVNNENYVRKLIVE